MTELDNKTCSNCGKQTSGNFCAHCGQSNRDYFVTFGQLFRDFLNDYLTFDTKFFRSIVPLLIA